MGSIYDITDLMFDILFDASLLCPHIVSAKKIPQKKGNKG